MHVINHFAWLEALEKEIAAQRAPRPSSPWSNVSDERYGEAMQRAIERLDRKGEFREPTSDEVDFELECMSEDEPEGLCG